MSAGIAFLNPSYYTCGRNLLNPITVSNSILAFNDEACQNFSYQQDIAEQELFKIYFKNILFFRWQYERSIKWGKPDTNFLKTRLLLIKLNAWDLERLDPERYKSEFLTLPPLTPII